MADIRVTSALQAHRFGPADIVVLAVMAGVWFFLPGYLPLATQVAIMAIFALSLDLALGYGGIETLGHAAFFGLGAYGAGLWAMHVTSEPLSGLVAGAVIAAIFGLVSGVVVLRTRGLALVMLTLACATMLHETANSARSLTGGDDGLTGYTISPILGMWRFDLWGKTAYIYACVLLIVAFLIARLVANSHFGLTLRGIRTNPDRMRLLGVPVLARLVAIYAIAGALAGMAGALSAQVTGIVALNSLAFALSGNVVIMLVLGGTGRLYGALAGAALFVVLSDRAAALNPFHWLFGLGAAIILIVWLAPDGITGRLAALRARLQDRIGGQS